MRTELLTKLRELKIEKVDCSYYGYGDSGNVDTVTTTPAINLESVQMPPMPHPWRADQMMERTLGAALNDFFWTLAYNAYPGFENNDGGQGEVVWDITTDKIMLDHSYNYTETISEPTVEL